jgi:mRNA-degrading endonuclease toxin of MazEF toxin-antitoxin module
MPKGRDRGAARAIPPSSRRKPLTSASTTLTVVAAVTSQAAKGPSLNDASRHSSPDAELPTLLVALKQQNDLIAAIEEEGRQLPEGITDASRDQERRLHHALDRRAETLDCIITTPASTPAGLRVKAKALRLATLGYVSSNEGRTLAQSAQYGDRWNDLALSLAHDVLAWTRHRGTCVTRR